MIISASESDVLRAIPNYVEPVGTIWANAIRMTVIPLIVSLLVTSIAADRRGTSTVASLGGRVIGIMLIMIAATATFAGLVGPAVMSMIALDESAIAAARAGGATSTVALPPFRNWLIDLVPANPVKAAADGAL